MASFFVDANTVISALGFVGNESALLEYAHRGLCDLVTNEHVREEVRRFLERRPRLSPARRGQAMARLARRIVVLPDPSREDPVTVADDVPHDTDLNEGVPPEIVNQASPWSTGIDPGPSGTGVDWDQELRKSVPRALTTRQALRRIEAELRSADVPADEG